MTTEWRDILSSCSDWCRFRDSLQSGHRVHAYLFECGGAHAGAFFARSFGRLLNCTGEAPPCEKCTACTQIARGWFPGVTEVWPIGTSVSIGQTREIIKDAAVRFGSGIQRVMVLHGADRLQSEAANSLLKVLEEPVSQVTMVLLAESAESVLPTIRSRCQVQKFSRLDLDKLAGSYALSPIGRELLPVALDLTLGNPEVLLQLEAEIEPMLARAGDDWDGLLKSLGEEKATSFGLELTLPLDHLASTRYTLGLARLFAHTVADLVDARTRAAAVRFSSRMSGLAEALQKLAAKEVAKQNKELKERFQQDVHHPLLSDEKRFLSRIAELHAMLLLRVLVRVLWMAFRAASGRAEPEAKALGVDGPMERLARLGPASLAARARRVDQLKGMIWANVSLGHVLDEVALGLVDPDHLLPMGFSPFSDSASAAHGWVEGGV